MPRNVSILEFAESPVYQAGSREAFLNYIRITVERGPEFLQHAAPFGVLQDPIHLGLQQVFGDRPMPDCLKSLRFGQIVSYLGFDRRGRQQFIERGFRLWVFFRPSPVPPVNLLDGSLIVNPLLYG